jgi:hypothetical protein
LFDKAHSLMSITIKKHDEFMQHIET